MTSRRDLNQLRRAVAKHSEAQSSVPAVQIPPGGIIEFTTSSDFLGLHLFPLQVTILKAATLRLDLFTAGELDRVVTELERLVSGSR